MFVATAPATTGFTVEFIYSSGRNIPEFQTLDVPESIYIGDFINIGLPEGVVGVPLLDEIKRQLEYLDNITDEEYDFKVRTPFDEFLLKLKVTLDNDTYMLKMLQCTGAYDFSPLTPTIHSNPLGLRWLLTETGIPERKYKLLLRMDGEDVRYGITNDNLTTEDQDFLNTNHHKLQFAENQGHGSNYIIDRVVYYVDDGEGISKVKPYKLSIKYKDQWLCPAT